MDNEAANAHVRRSGNRDQCTASEGIWLLKRTRESATLGACVRVSREWSRPSQDGHRSRGCRLGVTADEDSGVVDWRLAFPDGTVGLAQSRVTETTRGTCIYSFVLHAPPVALEHVEGALEAQRALLQSELARLKSLLEQ
jgi:hypothetical protein